MTRLDMQRCRALLAEDQLWERETLTDTLEAGAEQVPVLGCLRKGDDVVKLQQLRR